MLKCPTVVQNVAIAVVKAHVSFAFNDPQHHGIFPLEHVHCAQTEHGHGSCHELDHVIRHTRVLTCDSRPVSRHEIGNAVQLFRHFGWLMLKNSSVLL